MRQVGTVNFDLLVEFDRQAQLRDAIDKREIGALLHGSVCRDHLEPATACRMVLRVALEVEQLKTYDEERH